MTYPSDVLDCVGFLRSDVWPLLAKGGIDAPLVLPTAKQDRPDCPEWMHVMALLPTLSETEAASAFAGVDLQAPGYRSDEEMAEVTRWETVLCRAIRAQAIPAKAVTFDKDGVYGVKCAPHYAMGMVALIEVGQPVNLDEAKAVKHTGKAKTVFAELLGQAVAAK